MTLKLYELCGADAELLFSPHCWKARLALAHKGLDHQTLPTPFTAIGGIGGGDVTRTVPVLDDGGALVPDSFAIALHLDRTVPERPLFGPGGIALARFVEASAAATLMSAITPMILTDIHAQLAEPDQVYFRTSREKRLGRTLEEAYTGVDTAVLTKATNPLRHTLRHADWLGGDGPMFIDYIIAGGLIWFVVFAGRLPLPDDDPVTRWFERILDLHDGAARKGLKLAA